MCLYESVFEALLKGPKSKNMASLLKELDYLKDETKRLHIEIKQAERRGFLIGLGLGFGASALLVTIVQVAKSGLLC